MCEAEKARGMKESERGSYCLSIQYGHTQSRLYWITLLLMSPRAWKITPARSSSIGSPTSEGWAKLRSRASNSMGSRKPCRVAALRISQRKGAHLLQLINWHPSHDQRR